MLLLTHLLFFVPIARAAKAALTVAAFAFALLDEGGGWLVRFVSPSLAPLKIAGFVGFQACLAFLLATLGIALAQGRRLAPLNGRGEASGAAAERRLGDPGS